MYAGFYLIAISIDESTGSGGGEWGRARGGKPVEIFFKNLGGKF